MRLRDELWMNAMVGAMVLMTIFIVAVFFEMLWR
jgi:hypothetical protein